jgi:hypothetical protein
VKRTSVAFAAVATTLLAGPSLGHGHLTAQQELQSAQFLVGTWNCSHSVGDFSGTYTTAVAKSLGNLWLKQTYDFPATGEGGAVQAEYFIGYDARSQRWVRFGAMSTGQYFAMVGTRADNVWKWNYVLPGQSGSAVYTKKSDSQYTVDGPSYTENGKPVTEHHSCRKSAV